MIKNWLLRVIYTVPFVKASIDHALAEAKRQGGVEAFPLAHKDILLTIESDVENRAQELARVKLNALLSVVDENLILSVKKAGNVGVVYIGGEKADAARLANLKSEANFLVESDLWKVLNESVRELAGRAMFVSGENIEDMKKGRSMLYLLDTQNRIVALCKSYQHKEIAS